MPSTSPAQQKLMGQAYAVRKFNDSNGKDGLDPSDIGPKWRDKIIQLSKGMSKKDLKDFTQLKEESIATPASVNGMGSVALPHGDSVGSGDFPAPLDKKNKIFKRFKEFALVMDKKQKIKEEE